MQKLNADSKQLNNLETKFLAFLKDVSLRPMEKALRQRGRDGLHSLTLRFQGSGVSLERPNCHGRYVDSKSRSLSLQWGDEALNHAVAEAQRFCPNVSRKQIRMTLRRLMIRMFDEQAVREDTDTDSPKRPDPEESSELETILAILDPSGVRQELFEMIQQLRSLPAAQIVYVPIEGLSLTDILGIGDVELHHLGKQSELDKTLIAREERQGKESVAHARRALKRAGCYATVESTGDDGFVRNEATKKVRQALHILSFCLSSTSYQPSWNKIRISSVLVNRRSPTKENPDEHLAGLHTVYPGGRCLDLRKSRLLDVVNSECVGSA